MIKMRLQIYLCLGVFLSFVFTFCKTTNLSQANAWSEDDITKLSDEGELSMVLDTNSIDIAAYEFDSKASSDRKKLRKYLNKIPEWNQVVKRAIDHDANSGEEVRSYIDHYLENIDNDEKTSIGINPEDKYEQQFQNLYESFKLHSIWFYKDQDRVTIHFDHYLIQEGKLLTNYILVVKLNEQGSVIKITTES